MNKNPTIASTLDICLLLRDSLHTYKYDTVHNRENNKALIHGTALFQEILEQKGIVVINKLTFRFSADGFWQSEELEKELSKCAENPLNGFINADLGTVVEVEEFVVKHIKPLLNHNP